MTQTSIFITHCILWNTLPGPHKTRPRAAGGPRVEDTWLRACSIYTPNFLTLLIECKCRTMLESQFIIFAISRVHWRGSLWINMFTRSSSNPKGLPERGVLMRKRSSLKRKKKTFYCRALSDCIILIHGANVSCRFRCFRPSIELKEKNMSEVF